jgi:hypothetical protein
MSEVLWVLLTLILVAKSKTMLSSILNAFMLSVKGDFATSIKVAISPRDAQRVLTHQESGLKASFLTLPLPEGRDIFDPLPVKSANIERACEAPLAESASRCASRRKSHNLQISLSRSAFRNENRETPYFCASHLLCTASKLLLGGCCRRSNGLCHNRFAR